MANRKSDPSISVFQKIERLQGAVGEPKKGPKGSLSTDTYRPKRGSKGVADPQPAAYVDSKRKFVLREEPDQRVRLVRTVARKATPLSKKKSTDPEDNRVRITDTTKFPHRVNGLCIMTFPDNEQYIATGTLVSRCHVLTAGHVVYSKDHGGWAKSVQFNAAQNDWDLPYGSAWAAELITFKGWIDNELPAWDIGMLILDRNVGFQTGYMGLYSDFDEYLVGHPITVAGYPADKGGQQLWAATAPINAVNPYEIFHKAYTKPGMSGAAIYGTWPRLRLEHVCGVHTRGQPDRGSRISDDKFWRIRNEWLTR